MGEPVDDSGVTSAVFAPPSTPGATVPAPPTSSVLIDVQPPPKRKRTGLWVGIAAVVALIAGAGGFLALRKDDGDKKETFSLAAAARNAEKSTAYSFHLTTSLMGTDVGADGSIDTESRLMSIDIDTGAGGIGKFSAIMDLDNKVMYMSAEPFKELIPGLDAEFIKFDLAELADETGTSMFDELPVDDPLSVAPLFEQGDVTDLGPDDVNGEPVHHFTVTLDSGDLTAVKPEIEKTFEDAGVDVPESITYDVYVTEDNQLRRLHLELSVGGQPSTTDMIFTPVADDAPRVAIPTDVIDFKDLQDLAG